MDNQLTASITGLMTQFDNMLIGGTLSCDRFHSHQLTLIFAKLFKLKPKLNKARQYIKNMHEQAVVKTCKTKANVCKEPKRLGAAGEGRAAGQVRGHGGVIKTENMIVWRLHNM